MNNSGTGVPPVCFALLLLLSSLIPHPSSFAATNTTWKVATNNFTFSVLTSNRTDTITDSGTGVPPVQSNPPLPKITLVASSLNPTGPFWVRADVTNISAIVKVTFVVDGANYHDESIPPYFMCGDNGVTPTLCALSNGTHTIRALVITNSGTPTGAVGVSSPPLTITVSGTPTGAVGVVSNPAPPSTLASTGATTGSISFVWSYAQSSNASNAQAVGFIFELSKISSNNFVPVWSNTTVTVTNVTIPNLAANTTYWGRVRAYN